MSVVWDLISAYSLGEYELISPDKFHTTLISVW